MLKLKSLSCSVPYNNNDQPFKVANFKSGTFYLKVKIATFKGVQLHIGHPFKLNKGYLYQ